MDQRSTVLDGGDLHAWSERAVDMIDSLVAEVLDLERENTKTGDSDGE